MRIIATFNIINEAQFIREAVKSVLWADKIIIVDGAGEGYPSKVPWSTDGTLDIIHDLQTKHKNIEIIYAKHTFWKYDSTNEKVDAYLRLIKDGEYFIRMNGDEVFEGDPPRLYAYIEKTGMLPLYSMGVYPTGDVEHVHWCPKILRKTPFLNVTAKHAVLTNKFEPPYRINVQPRGKVDPVMANIPMKIAAINHHNYQRIESRAKERDTFLKHYVNTPHTD